MARGRNLSRECSASFTERGRSGFPARDARKALGKWEKSTTRPSVCRGREALKVSGAFLFGLESRQRRAETQALRVFQIRGEARAFEDASFAMISPRFPGGKLSAECGKRPHGDGCGKARAGEPGRAKKAASEQRARARARGFIARP